MWAAVVALWSQTLQRVPMTWRHPACCMAEATVIASSAYEDNDLIWCREDGSPYPPDYVSRHFVELAERAGLPRIQLHAGRHTAASLALEAGVDIKVVSERMGHSTTVITQNLYQHVRRVVHDKAAEAIVQLLPDRGTKRAGETG